MPAPLLVEPLSGEEACTDETQSAYTITHCAEIANQKENVK